MRRRRRRRRKGRRLSAFVDPQYRRHLEHMSHQASLIFEEDVQGSPKRDRSRSLSRTESPVPALSQVFRRHLSEVGREVSSSRSQQRILPEPEHGVVRSLRNKKEPAHGVDLHLRPRVHCLLTQMLEGDVGDRLCEVIAAIASSIKMLLRDVHLEDCVRRGCTFELHFHQIPTHLTPPLASLF